MTFVSFDRKWVGQAIKVITTRHLRCQFDHVAVLAISAALFSLVKISMINNMDLCNGLHCHKLDRKSFVSCQKDCWRHDK